MYVTRHLETEIEKASEIYPVVMVCGPRQVGKSTMLHHLMEPSRRYVTLDDAMARHLAETDPGLFFETYDGDVLIDEFQRVPGLLVEIKRIVDAAALAGKPMRGRFWLTGSQKFLMMENAAESLAGRVAVFDLPPLSKAELEGRPGGVFSPEIPDLKKRLAGAVVKNVHQVYEAIFRGGMPRLVVENLARDRFYADYVNTYLERDVKGFARVGKLTQFYDFLGYLAARTGQQLHYEEIARAIGVTSPTVKEWVSILERSGIVYLLRAYSTNLSKRLVKAPKIYFMDTGLAAYLCRWPTAETLEKGAMDGAFFETYAVTEIVKSFLNAGRRDDLYYYRDVDGQEIDLMLVGPEKVYPIEIKKAKAPSGADKNFAVLEKLGTPCAPGLVLCMSEELVPLSRHATLCPLAVL